MGIAAIVLVVVGIAFLLAIVLAVAEELSWRNPRSGFIHRLMGISDKAVINERIKSYNRPTALYCSQCGAPVWIQEKVILYDVRSGKPARYQLSSICENLHHPAIFIWFTKKLHDDGPTRLTDTMNMNADEYNMLPVPYTYEIPDFAAGMTEQNYGDVLGIGEDGELVWGDDNGDNGQML